MVLAMELHKVKCVGLFLTCLKQQVVLPFFDLTESKDLLLLCASPFMALQDSMDLVFAKPPPPPLRFCHPLASLI